MHLIINNSSMIPIYEQITDQVKRGIVSGSLKENDLLPSVRSLAGELRISSLTVKKAYDRLEDEGFVVTVHGKGTYVAATDMEAAMEARRKAAEDDLCASIERARRSGLSKEEILETIDIIMEDNTW